jgi:hypothetical protein
VEVSNPNNERIFWQKPRLRKERQHFAMFVVHNIMALHVYLMRIFSATQFIGACFNYQFDVT